MCGRIVVSFLVFIFLVQLTVLAPGSAAGQTDPVSWHHVSVTTTFGTTYEDVSVTWTLAGYSIKLTHSDGTETDLRPSQVETIRDSSGLDITNAVAEASEATDEDFALIGDKRIIPFEFGLMLTAGGSGAMYQAGGGFDPTFAFLGGARISLSSWIYLSAQYRRQRVIEPVYSTGGDISADTNELHFLVGFRVTHPKENNNYHYVELGVCVVQFPERFNAESGTWNDGGSTGDRIHPAGRCGVSFFITGGPGSGRYLHAAADAG